MSSLARYYHRRNTRHIKCLLIWLAMVASIVAANLLKMAVDAIV